MKFKRNVLKAAVLGATFSMVAPTASALTILSDWDVDFTSFGGVNYDTLTSAHIEAFQHSGDAFVIQEATGAGGTVTHNDRFYEVAFIYADSASFVNSSGGTGSTNIENIIGTGNAMYFMVEGGGSVDLIGTPEYRFDFGRISLIMDSAAEGTFEQGDEAANADGQTFNDIVSALQGELTGGTFSMPTGPGDALLTADGASEFYKATGAASTDGSLTELALLTAATPGIVGGLIPVTDNIPDSALEETTLGATIPVTDCVSGVFFDGATGADLCSASADPDPLLTEYYWTVGGTVTSRSGSTNYTSADSTTLISFFQDVGDDAAPSLNIPEPGTLALLGLGLFGLGLGRRKLSA